MAGGVDFDLGFDWPSLLSALLVALMKLLAPGQFQGKHGGRLPGIQHLLFNQLSPKENLARFLV